MTDYVPCEFFIIRYVPDIVRGEFVNIGVILRLADPAANGKSEVKVRFTQNWRRVRCLDPDADIEMLATLESEWTSILASETPDSLHPMMIEIADTFSNSIQTTELRACLGRSLELEIDHLFRLYVDSSPQMSIQYGRRMEIFGKLRSQFELAGIWSYMQKRIAASQYTEPGDPLRLDCGYQFNGTFRAFHAVSFQGTLNGAKALAYSAPLLSEGILRTEHRNLDLVAVIEPPSDLFSKSGEGEVSDASTRYYHFGLEILRRKGVRPIPTSGLSRVAEAARIELQMQTGGMLP